MLASVKILPAVTLIRSLLTAPLSTFLTTSLFSVYAESVVVPPNAGVIPLSDTSSLNATPIVRAKLASVLNVLYAVIS